MILRILLFSNSDFSDRLCQNDSFCCMICTGFWKRGRSKEVLEAQRKGKICSLTQARSKIMKIHLFSVTTQKCSFRRQVLDENANRVCHLERLDFPRLYVLKHFVKIYEKNEIKQQNCARHAGETHNNNCLAFGAPSFTCTGMKIFCVTNASVSFTLGKVTSMAPTGNRQA